MENKCMPIDTEILKSHIIVPEGNSATRAIPICLFMQKLA